MSAKETVQEVKKTFEQFTEKAEKFQKSSEGFDKDLSTKIKRASEIAKEVVEHIQKRSEK